MSAVILGFVLILLVEGLVADRSLSDAEAYTGDSGSCTAAASLLQRQAATRKQDDLGLTKEELDVDDSDQRITSSCDQRLAWFHIPKCGTSFGNTLFHFANASLPQNATLSLAGDSSGPNPLVPPFLEEYPLDHWFRGCFWLGGNTEANQTLNGNPAAHRGILEQDWEEYNGDFLGFFRQPVARLRSAWHYFILDTNAEAKMTAEAYARRTEGMVTKMLAGQLDDARDCSFGNETCPSENVAPNADLALARLDGFKFIGLTEHWALSVCLFHKMFGGTCGVHEFYNIRRTSYNQTNESDLGDDFFTTWNDPSDNAVYNKAVGIFWRNVQRYGVSKETCTEVCSVTGEHFE